MSARRTRRLARMRAALRRAALAGAALALLAAAAPARAVEGEPAELALVGGAVYTLDAARSWAQAVAIRGGRIVYVGSDAGVAPWIGPKTRVVRLEGRMLLPGFQDAHVHPVSGGLELTLCDLNGLPTRAAVVEKVRACAAEQPGPWLVGGGWALPFFPGGNPDRALLDELSPGRPAYLAAADGHSSWVNSRALALAKIDAKTPDPPNGRIERDAKTGEPTGTLRESAMDLVSRLLPAPKPAELEAGLRRAIAHLNGLGITAAQEASADRPGLEAYRATDRRGELTLRVVAALGTARIAEELPPGSRADPGALAARLAELRSEFASPRLRPTAAKIFADGVIEARTAAMLEPYRDRPGWRGEPNLAPAALDALVAALVRQGFSVHIHAIGDRAVRMSLDSLEAAGARRGARGPRHQLAHIEVIQPEDMTRFRTLGVIANFQPLWAYADPYITDLTLPALAPETVRRIYPIGSAERAAAPLAFGSDWSVSSPDPLAGIQVAVTRQGLDGAPEPFLPDEAIRLDVALAAYTIGAAYALGLEAETGSIEVGKLADLVVLSHDLFALPPGRIATARVLLTLLEGTPVYRAADGDGL
jgi:predicted amidohydrolase YtcJ